MLDIRKIDGLITPNDQFFSIQHYNQPEVDPATYRLKLTGLVDKPIELTLADLQGDASPSSSSTATSAPATAPRAMQGLSSNGRFTGVRLRDVLDGSASTTRRAKWCSSAPTAAEEDVVFRSRRSRSSSSSAAASRCENAMKPEPMLAYALNGEPLTRDQGFPLRLHHAGLVRRRQREVALGNSPAGGALPRQLPGALVPHGAHRGRHRAERPTPRRSGWRRKSPGMQLKSVIARVTRDGGRAPGARLRAERRHAAEVGRSAESTTGRGSGPRSIPPTRSIPGSCSPIAGKAPRRASTRSSRA